MCRISSGAQAFAFAHARAAHGAVEKSPCASPAHKALFLCEAQGPARDKQTPAETEGHAGGSGRALFRRSLAQPKWKRVIKAALLRAGRAASPPPSHSSRGQPLPRSPGGNVTPGDLFRWIRCVRHPLNKGKDPALGSDSTEETRACLFCGLSVGQGLCCCLPCSRLEHPPPGEPGISGQESPVLALPTACSPRAACSQHQASAASRGALSAASVWSVSVLWSFVSAVMVGLVFWCSWHSRRQVDLGRGRAVAVLPSLCVVTPTKYPNIVLAACELGFHIDLGWWDICL